MNKCCKNCCLRNFLYCPMVFQVSHPDEDGFDVYTYSEDHTEDNGFCHKYMGEEMSRYCPEIDEKVPYLSCQECRKKWCDDDTFFCLVVGSRTFEDYSLMEQKLDKLLSAYQNRHIVIVSGGAKGADTLALEYAERHGYSTKVFLADWSKGNSAGYIRNRQMHEYLAKQKNRGCVAFWNGVSRGTAHNFKLCEEFNTPLRIIRF